MASTKSKSSSKPRKASPATPEQFRKLLEDDPNTAKIAQKLGVPLEAYVKQVVHLATHPKEDPQLLYVKDADLRSKGFTPPDAAAMAKHVKAGLEVIDAAGGTGFQATKKPLVNMSEKAAPQTHGPADPKLQADLAKDLRRGRRKG